MHQFLEQGDRTTDAVPTDLVRWPIPENCAVRVEMTVVGRGLTGGGRATFRREALISRQGTAAPVVDAAGSLQTVANAAAAGWTVTPVIVGNDVVIRMTGGTGVSVDWSTELDGVIIGPVFEG